MSSTNKDWIDWRYCEARTVLLLDLEREVLPIDATLLSAEDAWEHCYSHMPEFNSVPFTQFKARLKDHRQQVGARISRSAIEADALVHDRILFPRNEKNARGELVFDLHPAKNLLRADIDEGKHNELTPSQLQKTRPEYMLFAANKFKHRIYQEIRRTKFVNYLELEREKKKIKEKKAKEKKSKN